MLENAIYSILSPEGYASILWKDASKAEEAAEKMKLTAKDLYDLKVIDKIIDEPEDNFDILIQNLKNEIVETVDELKKLSKDDIVENRYRKFRNMGEYKKF